jgi:hypothetical protein
MLFLFPYFLFIQFLLPPNFSALDIHLLGPVTTLAECPQLPFVILEHMWIIYHQFLYNETLQNVKYAIKMAELRGKPIAVRKIHI